MNPAPRRRCVSGGRAGARGQTTRPRPERRGAHGSGFIFGLNPRREKLKRFGSNTNKFSPDLKRFGSNANKFGLDLKCFSSDLNRLCAK